MTTAAPARAISAHEAETSYRLRHGTVRQWWLDGRIAGKERPGRGRSGKTLWVRAADVEREALGVGA